MKEHKLKDFEGTILLIVKILESNAYAFKIAEEFELQKKRTIAIGAVHSTLSSMEDKGFLTSALGEASAERGRRRKRIYTINAEGQRALEIAHDLKRPLRRKFPAFANEKLNCVLE